MEDGYSAEIAVFSNASCVSIHQQIAAGYQEGQASFTEGMDDRTEGVLIQHRETDFEFLKRVAGRTGLYLVPDALNRGSRYTVGLPKGIRQMPGTEQIRIKVDMCL